MPRVATYLGSDVKVAASSLAESLADVKLHQNMEAALDSHEFLRSLYDEFVDENTKDECDILCICCIACAHSGAWVHCCEACCGDRRRHRQIQSWIETSASSEAPEQHVMGGAEEPQPSFLERLGSMSSSDLGAVIRHFVSTKEWTTQEHAALTLFGLKFGDNEKQNLVQCLEKAKAVAPDLLEKDGVNTTDWQESVKAGGDAKGLAKFLRVLAATAVAKHGAEVAQKGFAAVGLAECEQVICAGDLKYELDATGLHTCKWECPADTIPATFQSIGGSLADELQEKMNLTDQEVEGVEAAKEMEGMDTEEEIQHSRTAKKLEAIKMEFHKALNGDPLRLLKTQSTSELGHAAPFAVRYHGKCGPATLQIGDRAVSLGGTPEIPQGALVTVKYLGPRWLSFRPLAEDEAAVKYLGTYYTVKKSSLKRHDLAKVEVDEGTRDWLLSTGNTVEVSMPAKQDPSMYHRDSFWFPISSSSKDTKDKDD
mmetsp:Transcript_52052/g.97373  ORF Transcript_52052/g.97373 Transcript_52052/m.97373 type:complete len:483 (+) Transcript_52052:57-1505(+)